MPPATLEFTHHFTDGLYGREAILPAGTAWVGRIHKQGTIMFIMEGELWLMNEKDKATLYPAGSLVVAPAGTQRAGYCPVQTKLCTVMHTHIKDPDEALDALTTIPEGLL